MKLGIVYHMPFWRTADGGLWEREGSFARYVDSLAPYFDEISLCVPVMPAPAGGGTRVRASNVRLAPLPHFDGPRQFYPQLPAIRRALRAWVPTIDLLNCRVPTPAAWFAFREAVRAHVPTFLLVVGDLQAVAPTLPYRGVKRALFAVYTAFEEWAIDRMTRTAVTFANGADLAGKHRRQGARVFETKTTTIGTDDINTTADTCQHVPIRLLTVSRIDPRKGLRVLPQVVADLGVRGIEARIDIIGPPVGAPGAAEWSAIEADAARLGVASRVRLPGTVPLDRLMHAYRDYDVFVLPTLPGEGIPRVLLEAMAAGLPIVASRVSGIPSLITDEVNGLLVDGPTAANLTAALTRVVTDGALRRRLIANGYDTARAHTLDAQARQLIDVLSAELGVALQPRAVVAAS